MQNPLKLSKSSDERLQQVIPLGACNKKGTPIFIITLRNLQVVLTGGVFLGMGVEFSPFAHEVVTPSHQIPRGPHALGANDQAFPIGCDGFKEKLRLGVDVAVEQNFSFLAEDAQVHFVGVQVDSAVMLVLFGVKSHEKASFVLWFSPSPNIERQRDTGSLGGLL
jgi:hypothetical protein